MTAAPRRSKSAMLSIGIVAACAVAECATLPFLYGRYQASQGQAYYHDMLVHRHVLTQGVGQLVGTLLLLAVLLTLVAPRSLSGPALAGLRTLYRVARPTLFLLAFTLVIWLHGAIHQFPRPGLVSLYGGAVGALLGLILPVLAFVRLVNYKLPPALPDPDHATLRRRRTLLLALLVATWSWSLAFVLAITRIDLGA